MKTRKSIVPPSARGASGQSNSAPSREIVGAPELGLEHLRSRRRRTELGDALLEERRTERDVLGPPDRAIGARDGSRPFRGCGPRDRRASSRRSTTSCASGSSARMNQIAVGAIDVVGRDRRLAVRRQARGRFVCRRPAEDVEAEVVAHDAGEEPRVDGRRRSASCVAGLNADGSIDGQTGVHNGLTPVALSKISAMWPPPSRTVTRRASFSIETARRLRYSCGIGTFNHQCAGREILAALVPGCRF